MLTTGSRQLGGAAACRFCGQLLSDTVVDLGMSPLCERYLRPDQLNTMEAFRSTSRVPSVLARSARAVRERGAHPLGAACCSSFADSWVGHARDYTNMMIDRFGFDPHSEVIELASNDGYLVQWIVKVGVPSLGIEPAANVAATAEE